MNLVAGNPEAIIIDILYQDCDFIFRIKKEAEAKQSFIALPSSRRGPQR
jgi:hypothetical protein